MSGARKRILCVDDHSDTRDLITLILRDYDVTAAHSMAEAIRRATGERFDLYLLDYHLPVGTGLELCLLLRTFDRDTPILLVTGTGLLSESHVISAGAQGLLRKDDLADKLSAIVAGLLK